MTLKNLLYANSKKMKIYKGRKYRRPVIIYNKGKGKKNRRRAKTAAMLGALAALGTAAASTRLVRHRRPNPYTTGPLNGIDRKNLDH